MIIDIKEEKELERDQVIHLYRANQWSSAEKPELLLKALMNSDLVVTAWDGNKLVGLGNAITDGYLVVYYPHLLILPEYQNTGVGKLIIERFQVKYASFHQQILVADSKAIGFYEKCGFEKALGCLPMWIYNGSEYEV